MLHNTISATRFYRVLQILLGPIPARLYRSLQILQGPNPAGVYRALENSVRSQHT
jgi:hypothetical protein